MPNRLPLRLLALSIAATLASGMVLSPASGDSRIDRPSVSKSVDPTTATETLAKAKALFSEPGSSSNRRTGSSTKGRSATLVLRDLARQADDLPTASQRASASRILARPTDGSDPTGGAEPKYVSEAGSSCGAHVCVHWVEDNSQDAVQSQNDHNLATVPSWVTTTKDTMEAVYTAEVTNRGYLPPRSDGTMGGDTKTDVYLADVGDEGLYGYCASDQANRNSVQKVFAYCVLDNDYSQDQFFSQTPLENLRVTAAHEFFHAVQFAYDWTEDDWFMEGTAAWVEDEVYDSVNDNLQYLEASPMSNPEYPLDYTDFDYPPYGSWVFWKFLSEWAGAGTGDDPTIIRKVWEAADGPVYSTDALRKVLIARNSGFITAFTAFGTWSREPGRYFSEGRTYPSAPLDKAFTLTSARRSTGSWSVPMDHMTHSFIRFTPGSTLTGTWKLSVSVNMPDTKRGSAARVVVHKKDGGVTVLIIPLSSFGNGSRVFGFQRSAVSYLELDLANASARFVCDQGTQLSCEGVSVDDGLGTTFSATAIR